VDEDFAAVRRVPIFTVLCLFPNVGVVLDLELHAQDVLHRQHAKDVLGVIEFGGLDLEQPPTLFRLSPHGSGHRVKQAEVLREINVFRLGQPHRAREVDGGNVGVGGNKFVGIGGKNVSQRGDTNAAPRAHLCGNRRRCDFFRSRGHSTPAK